MQGRKKQSETIQKVLTYIRQYRILALLSLLFAAVTVFSTLYFPILTGNAVDLILGKGLVDFAGILSIIKKAGILIAVTAAAQWFMNVINNRITYQVIRDIREEAFQKIEKLPLKYLDAHPSGEMVGRCFYHCWNTLLYDFYKYYNNGSGSGCDSGIAFGCGIYCKTYVSDVSKAVSEQRCADSAD